MRISKKNIERLKYVEENISNSHLEKVVHNILEDLNPDYIYLLITEQNYKAYGSFADALYEFKTMVNDYNDPEGKLFIDEDDEIAKFGVYNKPPYVQIIRKEVI